MLAVKSILVVAHHERPEIAELITRASVWAKANDARLVMTAAEAAQHGAPSLGRDDPLDHLDLCLSLGGDGTMLRAVHTVAASATPIIGINAGALGYLTEVEMAQLESALDRWTHGQAAGRWRIEERMMLDVTVDGLTTTSLALNEAVLERQEPGHTVHVVVRIDGEVFTSYAADGMIVATPTGSTAYSLSARGPIVSPTHRAILVTAVAPHMLFDRTLVLNPDETVELELTGHRDAVLTVDGQVATELSDGHVVRVARSATVARVIRYGDRNFHQILKTKFGLADR